MKQKYTNLHSTSNNDDYYPIIGNWQLLWHITITRPIVLSESVHWVTLNWQSVNHSHAKWWQNHQSKFLINFLSIDSLSDSMSNLLYNLCSDTLTYEQDKSKSTACITDGRTFDFYSNHNCKLLSDLYSHLGWKRSERLVRHPATIWSKENVSLSSKIIHHFF